MKLVLGTLFAFVKHSRPFTSKIVVVF